MKRFARYAKGSYFVKFRRQTTIDFSCRGNYVRFGDKLLGTTLLILIDDITALCYILWRGHFGFLRGKILRIRLDFAEGVALQAPAQGSPGSEKATRSVLIFMHGRSRMTKDPRIPAMPGRARRVFTDQADIASTKREAP